MNAFNTLQLRPRPLPGPLTVPEGMHPVLARLLAARGVDPTEVAARGYALGDLPKPGGFRDIDRASQRIADAVTGGESILVVGDFDADGATSAALAVRGLRAMGAAKVDYLVPNRFEFGYGLSPEIVAEAAQRGPDLLITVDNGISSIAGVAAANARGIDVVVTDHHLPGADLPAAHAIVNPNQAGCGFPSGALAGVGVMFYVLVAVRARLRDAGADAAALPNLAQFLDLVALGTVADVVPLDAVNRILVAQGLARIRGGQCCAGIRALLATDNRALEGLGARDLGFSVAPRLNAAGRLSDMSLGIECLITNDEARASALAAELNRLNGERKAIEAGMREQAFAVADRLLADTTGDSPDTGLCLFDPEWHEGLVGLVAARVKDRFHRPVIAFAPAADPALLKGSGRSIEGLHMRDLLESISTAHPGLVPKFGGHAMAAGLSLERDAFDAFHAAFSERSRALLAALGTGQEVMTDGELAPSDFNLELARALTVAAPWGKDFPEPMFEGMFRVCDRRVVGTNHLKVKLAPVGDARRQVDGIAFGEADNPLVANGAEVRIAYRLEVNTWRERDNLQLNVAHILPA